MAQAYGSSRVRDRVFTDFKFRIHPSMGVKRRVGKRFANHVRKIVAVKMHREVGSRLRTGTGLTADWSRDRHEDVEEPPSSGFTASVTLCISSSVSATKVTIESAKLSSASSSSSSGTSRIVGPSRKQIAILAPTTGQYPVSSRTFDGSAQTTASKFASAERLLNSGFSLRVDHRLLSPRRHSARHRLS